ncbi:MAG TPA: hypothetical protein VER11_08440 [Polyangiaceae bacterium]|nr:hypothetical protein [Polyangiaceae bacterium]
MKRRFFAGVLGVFATALAACSPGYMKRSELESKHQGPADCEARCVELGMRMGALVLVSDTLPGCVCQPLPAPPPPPPSADAPKPSLSPAAPAPPAPPSAAPTPEVAPQGASAIATGSVVATMAAAAAARANQTDQHRRAQQGYIPP